MRRRFWCSWVQPTEDYRPLSYPPNAAILGWWCSGYAGHEPTLVAFVQAESKLAAENAVKQDWPEFSAWRFINEVDVDFLPSDRFPLGDWMKQRLGVEVKS